MQTIKLSNVSKSFSSKIALNKIDIEFKSNRINGLLGPNGSGKTTLFNIVAGFLIPDKGQVLLDGEDISNFPMYIRARRGISYLAQEPSIFRKMSVEDNILCVLEYLNKNKKENQLKLNQLLDEFGLNKSH